MKIKNIHKGSVQKKKYMIIYKKEVWIIKEE